MKTGERVKKEILYVLTRDSFVVVLFFTFSFLQFNTLLSSPLGMTLLGFLIRGYQKYMCEEVEADDVM